MLNNLIFVLVVFYSKYVFLKKYGFRYVIFEFINHLSSVSEHKTAKYMQEHIELINSLSTDHI